MLVAVAAVRVLGQVDPDDVVGRAGGELGALLRVDDVIRRRGEVLQGARHARVVVQGAERLDAGHRRLRLDEFSRGACTGEGASCSCPSRRGC